MKQKVVTIDVGHYSQKQIEELMEYKIHKVILPKTKRRRFKSWIYDICDTIGIALGFGGTWI